MTNRSGDVPALELERLTVRYGRTLALDDVSLRVAPGSVYALLGRNGAGKTSAVRCLLGQQRQASGRARLLGLDSWKERTSLMERVGVVPEQPDAPPGMTASALGSFCSRLYATWDAKRYAAHLERFDVPQDQRFERLSKGQKGQVMLGLALGHAPTLLVLDDPTLGLDVVARRGFFEELIGDLADRGTSVFITTHDLAGIEPIASRTGILHEGRLVVDEPLEELKARVRLVRCARTASGAPPELAPLHTLRIREREWGIEAIVTNYSDDVFNELKQTSGLADAEAAALPLEEVFIALAGEEAKP